MKLVETELPGVYVVEPQLVEDARGFFARSYCSDAFAARGLEPLACQSSFSYSRLRGTLRGLHFQRPPYDEAKLVRCTRGAVFDVAVDLRPDSPTFCSWRAATLTAENHLALYIPRGCAHGFLTLVDATEVAYQMSAPYVPEAATGVRWNDAAFAVAWPFAPASLSERDRTFPDFVP